MKIDINQFLKQCSCGRTHEILVDDIIIESGAIKKLPEILSRERFADKKAIVMICDTNTYDVAGKQVEALVPGMKKVVLNPDNLHANEHGVGLCEEGLKETGEPDLMIAVGSGTIHDITRYHAYNKNIDFISVPTAASVDGFVSTVAAMITSFNILGKPLLGLVFMAFLSGNPLFIGITVVVYAVAYAVFKLKNKEIVAYLDHMADKNLSVE